VTLPMVFACNIENKIVRCNVVAVLSCDHSRVLCVHVGMACGIIAIPAIPQATLTRTH
jgi:hypothetical protein